MSFYIYHHNDFDGIASAAIFAKFLSLEFGVEYPEIYFKSVDYNIKSKWPDFELRNPNAVLDFLYHQKSDWWFDHHSDPFLTKAVIATPYKRDKMKYWAPNFPSCPSLMISHFYRFYRKQAIYLKNKYKDLINWSDIIDGAQYPSVKDIYNYKNIYMNINKTLAIRNDDEYYYKIIDSIFFGTTEKFVASTLFNDLFKQIKKTEEESIKVISQLITIDNKIAFFDQSAYNFPFQRYLAYYLYPYINYRVAIFKRKELYSISVNYNVWKKEKNKVDLGSLCSKFGGGGRHDVGGVLSSTHNDAIKIAKSIQRLLKNAIAEQSEITHNFKANNMMKSDQEGRVV